MATTFDPIAQRAIRDAELRVEELELALHQIASTRVPKVITRDVIIVAETMKNIATAALR